MPYREPIDMILYGMLIILAIIGIVSVICG